MIGTANWNEIIYGWIQAVALAGAFVSAIVFYVKRWKKDKQKEKLDSRIGTYADLYSAISGLILNVDNILIELTRITKHKNKKEPLWSLEHNKFIADSNDRAWFYIFDAISKVFAYGTSEVIEIAKDVEIETGQILTKLLDFARSIQSNKKTLMNTYTY